MRAALVNSSLNYAGVEITFPCTSDPVTFETFCLPSAIQLHFAWLNFFGFSRHRELVSMDVVFVKSSSRGQLALWVGPLEVK